MPIQLPPDFRKATREIQKHYQESMENFKPTSNENLEYSVSSNSHNKTGLAILLGVGFIVATAVINIAVRSPRNEKEYRNITKPMVADMVDFIKREHDGEIDKVVNKKYPLKVPHATYGRYLILSAYPAEGSGYFIEELHHGIIYRSPKPPKPGKKPESNEGR